MNKNIFQKPQKINSHRFFEGNKKDVPIYLILIVLIIIFASKGFPGFDFSKTEQSKAATAQEIIPLQAARGPLLYDFHQLRAAGALMSLASGVIDYNTLLAIKHYQEIEITTFPGWEDIDTKVDGRIVKDPLTFYFNTLGNEDAIEFAKTLLWGGDAGAPPPTDWRPPDPMPGTLQYPVNLAIPAVSYSSHFYACRDGCSRYHAGIDLSAPKNTPVFAATDGIVININKTDRQGGGYGYWILIFHDKLNLSTHYAHLENVGVSPGQRVEAGQVIGGVGNTGATAYHLHFEVYPCQVDKVAVGKGYLGGKINCYAVDPIGYLPPIPKGKCSLGWNYYPDRKPTPPADCLSCIPPSQQCQ